MEHFKLKLQQFAFPTRCFSFSKKKNQFAIDEKVFILARGRQIEMRDRENMASSKRVAVILDLLLSYKLWHC